MSTSDNPYAAPQSFERALRPGIDPLSDVERIRKEHLSHEVSIQSIGSLYLLGSIAVFFMATGILLERGPKLLWLGGLLVLLALFQAWVAFGLRSLRESVKIPAVILCTFGLLAVPLGTLLNSYFLYLLLSKKGRYILSEPYQEVRAATPHIRYRTSWIVWVFIFLLVGVVLLAIFGAVVSPRLKA